MAVHLGIFGGRKIIGRQRAAQVADADQRPVHLGKFDQYKRDIPFATLAQAFQSLVRQILGQGNDDLAGGERRSKKPSANTAN